MSRQVRMVPKDWQHPVDKNDKYIPLFDMNYDEYHRDYQEEKNKWDEGFIKDYPDGWKPKTTGALQCSSFEEWHGQEEPPERFMPKFDPNEAIHYMMYETTSEGTPMSPAFATPEELAKWLADTKASVFGRMTAAYVDWLEIITGRKSEADQ